MTDSINDYIYQEEDSGTPFEEFENETSGGDDENYSKELTGATDTGGDYGGREKPGKSGDQSGRKKWSRYEEEKVLQVYFRDLLTEPLLTSTEEKELSAKIKECERKAREIKKKIDSMAGNRERADVKISKAESVDDSIKILDAQCKLYSEKAGMFREQFIKANLRLVVSIAKRHLGRGLPLTDLVQEGNLGLIRAVEKFDHTRGFKFSTYAGWWIHQAVTRAIAEKTHSVKIPVYVLEQSGKVFRAKYDLQDELGRKPLHKEIAERSGLSIDVVKTVLDGTDNVLSLDNPVKGEDSKTFMDFLPDTSESNQETASASLRIKELIEDSLIELTSKEEEILRMRYGVGSGDMYTLDEIGTRFGVTRERIRQIEKAALRKIARSGAAETLKGYL